MRTVKPTTVRFTDEDKALIVALKQRYGLISTIQVVRLALRMLVEQGQTKGDSGASLHL